MQTLIYHYGGLGDFITTLPFFYYWKRITNSKITLLGKPHFGRLAAESRLVDRIFDADSVKYLPFFLPEDNRAETMIESFDSIILFCKEDSQILFNALKFCRQKVLHQNPFPDTRIHIVNYHLSLLECDNSQDNLPFPLIQTASLPSLHPYNFFRNDKRYAAFHPGSGSIRKNWPVDYFLDLANAVRSRGIEIVWFFGPAETNIPFPSCDHRVISDNLSLVAEILHRCELFIGNDGGPAHLASAVGCKVLTIFGPSDPLVWKPLGRQVIVLSSNPKCGPCHPGPSVQCNHECLDSITPDLVIKSLIDGGFIM